MLHRWFHIYIVPLNHKDKRHFLLSLSPLSVSHLSPLPLIRCQCGCRSNAKSMDNNRRTQEIPQFAPRSRVQNIFCTPFTGAGLVTAGSCHRSWARGAENSGAGRGGQWSNFRTPNTQHTIHGAEHSGAQKRRLTDEFPGPNQAAEIMQHLSKF